MTFVGKYIYKHFGYEVGVMSGMVRDYLKQRKEDPLLEREFVEL